MAYSVGGKIEAADYNGFLTTFNAAWATGAGDSGYGQPDFPTVAVGDPVRARPATVNAGSPPTWSSTPEWRTLINSINAASNHQTGAAAIATGDFAASGAFPVASTATSGLIAYGTTVSAAITTVSGTQRLSAAAQGASTSTVATSTAVWNDYLQFAWTITFASDDAARFFFNAGGQIGAQASHTAGVPFTINQLISDLCSDAGTVWLSSTNGTPATVSLAGTSYNGITKVGGANPGGETISANDGFYALGAAATNVFTQTSDFVYGAYSGTNYKINLSYDGAGVVSFTVLIDEVPNGATVNAGTVSTLIVRPPDTTYLADSWGTPTVACAITFSGLSAQYLLVGGGGGGGGLTISSGGGGGGGGGVISGTTALGVGSYTVTVGAGGAGAGGPGGANGSSTSISGPVGFSTITALGGGGGGYSGNGKSLGTGGAADYTSAPGSGTAGQGFGGGNGILVGIGITAGGGGGGAGASGGNAIATVPGPGTYNAGNGGAGKSSSITGSSVVYGGGGGGGAENMNAGAGGSGGGGQSGQNGTNGLGGGGGGGGVSSGAPGNGGSGVAIIRYATAAATITYSGTFTSAAVGADTVLTLTGSGTLTVS